MKLIFASAIALLCFVTVSFGQTYDPNSLGEINVNVLNVQQAQTYDDSISVHRSEIISLRLCYGVYDDSGTMCRTAGKVTDEFVYGRRYGVIYDCTTYYVYTAWPLP